MSRPSHRAPLNLCSPLYERLLKISPLLLLVSITSAKPQMTITNDFSSPINKDVQNKTLAVDDKFDLAFANVSKTSNEENDLKENFVEYLDVNNYTYKDIDVTEDDTNDGRDLKENLVEQSDLNYAEEDFSNIINIKNGTEFNDTVENDNKVAHITKNPTKESSERKPSSVRNKEYQSLLDRFRRKNFTQVIEESNQKQNLEPNIISPDALEYHINNTYVEESSEIQLTEYKFENGSMEKLIDDVTRNKIMHDYFKTVNKEGYQGGADDVVIESDVNYNETSGNTSGIRQAGSQQPLNSVDRTTARVPSFRTPKPGIAGTGGGPNMQTPLTPIEDAVADIIGKDFGPIPGVRVDVFGQDSQQGPSTSQSSQAEPQRTIHFWSSNSTEVEENVQLELSEQSERRIESTQVSSPSQIFPFRAPTSSRRTNSPIQGTEGRSPHTVPPRASESVRERSPLRRVLDERRERSSLFDEESLLGRRPRDIINVVASDQRTPERVDSRQGIAGSGLHAARVLSPRPFSEATGSPSPSRGLGHSVRGQQRHEERTRGPQYSTVSALEDSRRIIARIEEAHARVEEMRARADLANAESARRAADAAIVQAEAARAQAGAIGEIAQALNRFANIGEQYLQFLFRPNENE